MAKTVLITGASGLLGRHLCSLLLSDGYEVRALSRGSSVPVPGVESFRWDIEKGYFDPQSLENVEAVIHLAGENLAARPWTKGQKQKIIRSRTDSIRLLYKHIHNHPGAALKTIVSASAVGYYGDRGGEVLYEHSRPGNDFMSQTCIAWENAVNEGASLGLRVVRLRTGVVLSKEGGALPKLAAPIKLGLGAALGPGDQWIPWIHLDDAVKMYKFVLENERANTVYNHCAPAPVTNNQLTRGVAGVLHRPLWLPAIPAFALRILLGEMRAVLLSSTKTSADKIMDLGFQFQFNDLQDALTDIYGQ